MNRRSFIGGLLGSAALPSLAAEGTTDGRFKASQPVKFCVFADIHYQPRFCPNGTKEFLGKILERAEKAKCDLIMSLGDFAAVSFKEYHDFYNASKVPAYHTLGNHDTDWCKSPDEVKAAFKAFGLGERGYRYFDKCGHRFICLDGNHILFPDGHVEHYEGKKPYKRQPGSIGGHFTDEQVKWLEETINSSPYPCFIFSHQGFERPLDPRTNAPRLKALVEAVNRATSGKVRMCFNGHWHIDYYRESNGVRYLDVNTASEYWLGSKYRHQNFPPEMVKQTPGIECMVYWDNPLSAIITAYPDGRLKIEGSHANFVNGVTAEMCGYTADEHGRTVHASILSADLD